MSRSAVRSSIGFARSTTIWVSKPSCRPPIRRSGYSALGVASHHLRKSFGWRGRESSESDCGHCSAGGLLSTAQDLARWLGLQINHGELDGEQIFPRHVIAETHRVHAVTEDRFGRFGRSGYGLGWYIGEYDGQTILHHFGGFSGFRAHVSFMPGPGIGVAVLANEAGMGMRIADFIAGFAYDWWRSEAGTAPEYLDQQRQLVAGFEEQLARNDADRARRAEREWTVSQDLGAYMGTYVSPLIGTLRVNVDDGVLAAHLGNLHSLSTPFTEPDSIRVIMMPPGGQVVQFELDVAGRVLVATFARQRYVKQATER